MKFLMLVCVDGPPPGPVDPIEPWAELTAQRGVRITGDRLKPAAEATTVRVREGEVLVSDGPFAEAKEYIGGFDVLDCRDLDEAIEIASRHPVAKFGGLELRPFWPMEGDA